MLFMRHGPGPRHPALAVVVVMAAAAATAVVGVVKMVVSPCDVIPE